MNTDDQASDKATPRIKVIPVFEDGKLTRFKFYCPYCRAWHYHGPPSGHRLAHCWSKDSLYRASGHVLVLEEAQSERMDTNHEAFSLPKMRAGHKG